MLKQNKINIWICSIFLACSLCNNALAQQEVADSGLLDLAESCDVLVKAFTKNEQSEPSSPENTAVAHVDDKSAILPINENAYNVKGHEGYPIVVKDVVSSAQFTQQNSGPCAFYAEYLKDDPISSTQDATAKHNEALLSKERYGASNNNQTCFFECPYVKKLWNKLDAKGSFALYSLSTHQLIGYNFELASKPIKPYASFKYINALTALDLGIARNLDDTLYSRFATDRYIDDIERKTTIRSSFAAGSNQFSSFVANKIGPKRYADALYRLTGKEFLIDESNITSFWFDGTLRYSIIEELNFLSALATRQLNFSKEAQEQVLEVSLLAVLDKDGNVVALRNARGSGSEHKDEHLDMSKYFVIYGKSSANDASFSKNYVRYSGLVKDDKGNYYAYATILKNDDLSRPNRAVSLTVDLLRQLGVIPYEPNKSIASKD